MACQLQWGNAKAFNKMVEVAGSNPAGYLKAVPVAQVVRAPPLNENLNALLTCIYPFPGCHTRFVLTLQNSNA